MMKHIQKLMAALLLCTSSAAHAFAFSNYSYPNKCISRAYGYPTGYACPPESILSSVDQGRWSQDRHICFVGTNLCLQANSSNSVSLANYAAVSRQRWVANIVRITIRLTNTLYGSSYFLFYSASTGQIGITNTYPSDGTRFFTFRY